MVLIKLLAIFAAGITEQRMSKREEVHTISTAIIPNPTDGQQLAARSIVRSVDVMALLSLSLSLSLSQFKRLHLIIARAYVRVFKAYFANVQDRPAFLCPNPKSFYNQPFLFHPTKNFWDFVIDLRGKYIAFKC